MASDAAAEPKVHSSKMNSKIGFYFPGQALEGLAGNGKMTVSVNSGEFQFQNNPLVKSGSFKVVKDGVHFSPRDIKNDSFFFPGGVSYSMRLDELVDFEFSFVVPYDRNLLVLRLVIENKIEKKQELDLLFDFKISLLGAPPTFEKEVISAGDTRIFFNSKFSLTNELSNNKITVSVPVQLNQKEKKEILVILAEKELTPYVEKMLQSPSSKIVEEAANHYLHTGFTLQTPDEKINQAVPFLKYHLQLGYDWPRTMVADIFRWRDVWSRDLGSGSAPGALGAGMFEAARNSLIYDLKRHQRADPFGYRVTEDTSQGGSAEGLGWISSCVWLDYLYSGDKEFLKSAYEILEPWADSWIARDYDGSGLIIDVTEWMDHSRFLRLPEGIRTLYSNVLFYVFLDSMSKMAEVVEPTSKERYSNLANRTIAAIHSKLWNDSENYFNNYTFWDVQDEKLDSVANSLAILFGVTSPDKIPQMLDKIRTKNWRRLGSANIFPAMKYVGIDNDQNVKCWPWWQAKESKARFLNNDVEGGMELLGLNLDTLKYQKFPGLMEEYYYPDDGKIDDFAGHSFITGAGSTLDCIIGGLFGFEILSPRAEIVRIAPRLPKNWTQWNVTFPLVDGQIECARNEDKITCNVKSESVERLELKLPEENRTGKVVINNVEISVQFDGSFVWMDIPKSSKEKMNWGKEKLPDKKTVDLAEHVSLKKLKIIEFQNKRQDKAIHTPLIFSERKFPDADPASTDALKNLFNKLGKKVTVTGVEFLSGLDVKQNDSLFFTQFVLPVQAENGKETREIIERYIEDGGTVVLWGAKTFPKGTIGETGSLVEWVSLENVTISQPMEGSWRLIFSDPSYQKNHEDEEGFKKGFHRMDFVDRDWQTVSVRQTWEKVTGKDFNGYGWYRKSIPFPSEWQNKPVCVSLGKIDDNDWAYLNGHLIGKTEGWQEERFYKIMPNTPIYKSIRWGKENILAIQVLDSTGGGGLYEGVPSIGVIEYDKNTYQYFNLGKNCTSMKPVRGGIVSWGPGKFFNDWATALGLFGFNTDAEGIEFSQDATWKDLTPLDLPVKNVYTDFGVREPWEFIPLAYTTRKEQWVEGAEKDRYPCMAVIRNKKSGGQFVIVPPEIVSHPVAKEVLKRIIK